MHSFQSIASSKNTTLAVVAPGIAVALLATSIGLFVAILFLATILNNYLCSEIIIYHEKSI
jgi:biopolymer transport protein TolQ